MDVGVSASDRFESGSFYTPWLFEALLQVRRGSVPRSAGLPIDPAPSPAELCARSERYYYSSRSLLATVLCLLRKRTLPTFSLVHP